MTWPPTCSHQHMSHVSTGDNTRAIGLTRSIWLSPDHNIVTGARVQGDISHQRERCSAASVSHPHPYHVTPPPLTPGPHGKYCDIPAPGPSQIMDNGSIPECGTDNALTLIPSLLDKAEEILTITSQISRADPRLRTLSASGVL